ncbi:MAG: DnaJ domain-containing protein [Phycisphaerales bacterium]
MPRDAFDILGVPARFDLSPAAIRSAYLALSARLHPDAVEPSAASDPDAQARAAELNAAKQSLDDPESRADLLLRRLGGPAKEQDKSLPATFLAEMLHTRELIEEALQSRDDSRIDPWRDWAADRRRRHIATVGELFAALDHPAGRLAPDLRAAHLRSIRAELNMWRYIERLIEQLEPH